MLLSQESREADEDLEVRISNIEGRASLLLVR